MILLNHKRVPIIKFPNGETMIKTEGLNIETNNLISVKFEGDDDILHLIFLAKHLDHVGLKKNKILHIPYCPYERLDRTKGQTLFTLKYICQIINDLKFESVMIEEPHSDVVTALIDRVVVVSSIPKLLQTCIDENNINLERDFFYFPDTTAEKRQSEKIAPKNHLTGLKHRNFATGEITGLEIIGDVHLNPRNSNIIMVDDLCSYGGTFLKGAEKLREFGFEKIYLIVNHCENSIFKGELFKSGLIDKVYTTDSILNTESWECRAQIEQKNLHIHKII